MSQQLGLFVAGAAAATAVNTAISTYMRYSQEEQPEKRKLTVQQIRDGAVLALMADVAVLAPVLTGAAALEALRAPPSASKQR